MPAAAAAARTRSRQGHRQEAGGLNEASATRMQDLKAADELFAAGRFIDAQQRYLEHTDAGPRVSVRLGQIALLGNRVEEARRWLVPALRDEAGVVQTLLAQACRRAGDLAQAATHLRAVGRHAAAAALDDFEDRQPYALRFDVDATCIPFAVRVPLPLVPVEVNGVPAHFLLDTGAGEAMLDTAFALKAGVAAGGQEVGTFAGGKAARVRHGRLSTLRLGAALLADLPVQIAPLQSLFAPFFTDHAVEGIIGIDVLRHFLPILDYPAGTLVLRAKHSLPAEDVAWAPFWLAGDHCLVAWGCINRRHTTLMFLDSGQAGLAFAAPWSTVEMAGIALRRDEAGEGYGGGGAVPVVPFELAALSLGGTKARGVRGAFTGSFPLETQFGFRIGGLVGHEFFAPHALSLDFTRMRYALHPSSARHEPGPAGGGQSAPAAIR
jgi:hypothetical protein